MKALVITIIVIFGIIDILLVMGASKLEREREEHEWREFMEKRKDDGFDF